MMFKHSYIEALLNLFGKNWQTIGLLCVNLEVEVNVESKLSFISLQVKGACLRS